MGVPFSSTSVRGLLDAHREVHAILGPDRVVVVVEAEVDLDPLDVPGELGLAVVGGHGEPNSSPTSQVSSAEKRKASVCSMRPLLSHNPGDFRLIEDLVDVLSPSS